jgi:hypothetical protein
MTGEMVTIVNRTSQPLDVIMNGRTLVLQPGENHVTADWIRFAKSQHPRLGTFDEGGLDGDYLVGVKGYDDCSLIPPGQEHKAVERFDRSSFDDPVARSAEVVHTGITPPRRRVPNETGVPAEAIFANYNR